MSIWQWVLELVLIALLGATLFYALRLERIIGVLRRDRVGLGDVLATIRAALDDAQAGIEALRSMADGTGRALTRDIEAARQAQQDLQFSLDRLEGVAAKVEAVIKSGRTLASDDAPASAPAYSKAERDLLKVLRLTR
jgi:uncharacterized protein YoxC